MKWLGSFLLIFNLVFLPTGIVLAQTTSKVHDLYFQSNAYPELFDSSIELLEASGLLKNEILSCLTPLKNHYSQLSKVAIEQCKIAYVGDPPGEWECLKADPSASTAYWLDDMIKVINENNIWVNTYTGRNMLMAKQLAEQIQPGIWVSTINMSMPYLQNMISCP